MGTVKKSKSFSAASPLDSDEPSVTPRSGEVNSSTRNTSGCGVSTVTTSPNSLATSVATAPHSFTASATMSSQVSTTTSGAAPIPSIIAPVCTLRVSDIHVIPEGAARVGVPQTSLSPNSSCTSMAATAGVVRKKGTNSAATGVVTPCAIVVPSTVSPSGAGVPIVVVPTTAAASPLLPPPSSSPSPCSSSISPGVGSGATASTVTSNGGVPKASSVKDLVANEKLSQMIASSGCAAPLVSGITSSTAAAAGGSVIYPPGGSICSASPSITECAGSFPSSATLTTAASTQWFSFAYTGKTAVEEESVVLKDYVFGHRLGEGTYGSVYVVTYTPSGERFAMKVLQKEAVEAFEDQIVREATLMQSLDHPHVVKLVKFLESKTAYYLLMELAEGGELFDLILSSSYFDERTARRFFHQLMSAIEYCHSKGIAHRDLKAENLLLADNERLTVCDFGFSWMSPAEAEEDIEEGEEAYELEVGTVHYLPPEMVSMRKSETNGFQQDLWSAGVILFFMLTGRMPFDGREEIETMNLIELAELHFTEDELDRLSDGARELLGDMLQRDPLARPTLKSIMRDYDWFTEDLDTSMKSSTTTAVTSRQTTTFLDFSTPHAATDAEEKCIRSAFDKIDVDGFGRITRDQVRDMLITLCDGNPVRSSDVLELMKLFTGNEKSESVTFDEFHRAWVDKDLAHCKFTYNHRFQLPQILATKHEEVEREVVRQLRTAFDSVDAEHSGIITNDQWRDLFNRCKIPVSDSEIKSVVSFLDTCRCGSVSFEEFLVAIVQREMLVRHPMGRKLAAAMNLVGMLRARNVSDCVHHGFFVIGLQHAVLDKMLRYPRRLVLLCKDNDASPTDNVYTFRYFGDPSRTTSVAGGLGSPTLQDSLQVSVPTPDISSGGYGTPLYNDFQTSPGVSGFQYGDRLSAPQTLPAPMSVTHNEFQLPQVIRYAKDTQKPEKPMDVSATAPAVAVAGANKSATSIQKGVGSLNKSGANTAASPTASGAPNASPTTMKPNRTSANDLAGMHGSSKSMGTKQSASRDDCSSADRAQGTQCKRRGVPMVSVPCTPGNVVSLHHSSFSPCPGTSHSGSPTEKQAGSTAAKTGERKSRARPPQLTSPSNGSLDKDLHSVEQSRQSRRISNRPSCDDTNVILNEAERSTVSPHLKNSFGHIPNNSFGEQHKKEAGDVGSSGASKRATPVISRATPVASRPGTVASSEERCAGASKAASPTGEHPSKLRRRSDSTDSVNCVTGTPTTSKPGKLNISRAGTMSSIPPFTTFAASSRGHDDHRHDTMHKSASQGSLAEAERNSFANHSASSGKESPGSSITCSPACSNPPTTAAAATTGNADAAEGKKPVHSTSHSPQSTKVREHRPLRQHEGDRSGSPADLHSKKRTTLSKNASVDDLHLVSNNKLNTTPSAARSVTPRTTTMNGMFSSDWKRRESGAKSPRRPTTTTTPSRAGHSQSGPLSSPRRVAGTSCATAKPVVDVSERRERAQASGEAGAEKHDEPAVTQSKEKSTAAAVAAASSHKDPTAQQSSATKEECPPGEKKKKVTVENGSVASSAHASHHHHHTHNHHSSHHHSPSPSNKGGSSNAAAVKKVRSGDVAVRVKRGKHRMEALNVIGLCDFNLILSPACMGYTLVRFCRIHGKTLDFHEAVQFVSAVLDREREQAKTDTMAKGESEFM